ncbi:MAG: hypothetical protein ACI8Z1_002289, partial [Candidatus Azotimanducaceae bacterium]
MTGNGFPQILSRGIAKGDITPVIAPKNKNKKPVKKLKNILVVLDAQQDTQPALTRAAYLAKATGAKLHLFMCAYDAAVSIATFLTGGQRKTFVQTLIDGNEAMVQRWADACINDGVGATFD